MITTTEMEATTLVRALLEIPVSRRFQHPPLRRAAAIGARADTSWSILVDCSLARRDVARESLSQIVQ